MLTIRLARGGAKKKPYYSIVVTDSRNARDSGAIKEKIGYYNPVARGNELMIHMDTERMDHWIATGAQTSEKVKQLTKIFKKAQASGEKASMRTRTSLTTKQQEKEAAAKQAQKEAEKAAAEAEKAAAEAEKAAAEAEKAAAEAEKADTESTPEAESTAESESSEADK